VSARLVTDNPQNDATRRAWEGSTPLGSAEDFSTEPAASEPSAVGGEDRTSRSPEAEHRKTVRMGGTLSLRFDCAPGPREPGAFSL
jgi:hypothetical protein